MSSTTTSIQWTNATWNPLRGCSRVSEGCRHCYAERIAARFSGHGEAFHGVVTFKPARWTGEVRLVQDALDEPLRWRKPRRVFVNSMSDLFHEKVSNDTIAAIFGAMLASPAHTYQILTKRPARMREWFEWVTDLSESPQTRCGLELQDRIGLVGMGHRWQKIEESQWPAPSVWLGVSIENQQTADERIPRLLQTPATVRWVSYEPALGPVDLTRVNDGSWYDREGADYYDALSGDAYWRNGEPGVGGGPRLDWAVVGGESGPGARPFDLAWARQTITQCREAGVACFVKQVGSNPITDHRTRPAGQSWIFMPKDRKGGDPSEWPQDLRVREFPSCPA